MESGISEQKPVQTNHYRADDDDDDDTAERISRSSSQGLCVMHSVLPQFVFWLHPLQSLILESVHNQFGATDATILDFEHLDCKHSRTPNPSFRSQMLCLLSSPTPLVLAEILFSDQNASCAFK